MRTLLEDVETFLKAFPEVAPTRIGFAAVGDRDLVRDLREGRSPREATVIGVRRWMAEYLREAQKGAATRQRAQKALARALVSVEVAASPAVPAAAPVEAVAAS